jgi:hypothetical protein
MPAVRKAARRGRLKIAEDLVHSISVHFGTRNLDRKRDRIP